jgi:hypothetical protein
MDRDISTVSGMVRFVPVAHLKEASDCISTAYGKSMCFEVDFLLSILIAIRMFEIAQIVTFKADFFG